MFSDLGSLVLATGMRGGSLNNSTEMLVQFLMFLNQEIFSGPSISVPQFYFKLLNVAYDIAVSVGCNQNIQVFFVL